MGDFKIFEWLLGTLSGLLGLLYLQTTKRIELLERNEENEKRFKRLEDICEHLGRQIPSEFERSELTRQRIATEVDIRRIFQTLDEMKDRATTRHLELLEKIDEKADKT